MKSLETLLAELQLADHADPFGEISAIITQKEQQIIHLTPFKTDHQTALDGLATVAEKDVELEALRPLKGLYETFVQKVKTALASGTPEDFIALGHEFLTPATEKRRAELLAELATLPE